MPAVKALLTLISDQQQVPLGAADPADGAEHCHPAIRRHCIRADDHPGTRRHRGDDLWQRVADPRVGHQPVLRHGASRPTLIVSGGRQGLARQHGPFYSATR
jgi:hypothetical protein